MRWLCENADYKSEVLDNFDYCLLWITSDEVRLLNQWFEIPVDNWDNLRFLVKAYWEKGEEYKELKTVDQLQYLFKQLHMADQNPERLLSWFLQTQLTPGNLGLNMLAWTSYLDSCWRQKELYNICPSIAELYKKYVKDQYSSYIQASERLEKLWIDSPGYRSDWDNYLYEKYYKELAGTPSDICDEELLARFFRKFWHVVLVTMSDELICEFENRLTLWSISSDTLRIEFDPSISIKKSLGMDGFLPEYS